MKDDMALNSVRCTLFDHFLMSAALALVLYN